jgi:hypothetical protein
VNAWALAAYILKVGPTPAAAGLLLPPTPVERVRG